MKIKRTYKKVIVILIAIALLAGCSKKDTKQKNIKKQDKTEVIEEKITYKDNNSMPIGIYQDNNKLVRLTEYTANFNIDQDIAVFQIFPSNEENIPYTNKFGNMFYEKWSSLVNNHKIGFNLKYTSTDGTNISHNILEPAATMAYGNYLQIYLYDDYYHRNDSWYSHIENNEYNNDTLFTSIKITGGTDVNKINSPITLTVFTYDTSDDFDENKEYRGNSKYSIKINKTY